MMRVNHDYDAAARWPTWPPTTCTAASVIGTMRGHHRHRPVHRAGRPSHDHSSRTPQRGRVFWVVDNGSSHRGQAAIDRLAERFAERHHGAHPGARVVAQPGARSSSRSLQRKVLSPNDFTDLTRSRTPRRFETRYNATASPFNWKFTTADLDDLLTRLDQHDPHPASPAQAA